MLAALFAHQAANATNARATTTKVQMENASDATKHAETAQSTQTTAIHAEVVTTSTERNARLAIQTVKSAKELEISAQSAQKETS